MRRLALGAWVPYGRPSKEASLYLGADVSLLEEETRRCMNEYKMPGFIFLPFVLNEKGNSMIVGDERMSNVISVWDSMCRFEN